MTCLLLERTSQHSCDAADWFVAITVLTNSGKARQGVTEAYTILSDSINMCMLLYEVRVFDGLDAWRVTATELPKVKFKQRGFVQKEMKRAQFFRFHMVSLDEHIANRYARRILWPGPSRGHPVPKAPCSYGVLFRPLVSYPMPTMSYTMPNLKRKVPTLKSTGEGCRACPIWLQVSGEIWLVALCLWHPP